jgi:hypothetical protein
MLFVFSETLNGWCGGCGWRSCRRKGGRRRCRSRGGRRVHSASVIVEPVMKAPAVISCSGHTFEIRFRQRGPPSKQRQHCANQYETKHGPLLIRTRTLAINTEAILCRGASCVIAVCKPAFAGPPAARRLGSALKPHTISARSR